MNYTYCLSRRVSRDPEGLSSLTALDDVPSPCAVCLLGVDADTCRLTRSFKRISLPKIEVFVRHFRVAWERRFVIVRGKSKLRWNPLLMISDTDLATSG